MDCYGLIFSENKEEWMFKTKIGNWSGTIIVSSGFYPGLITKNYTINKRF